MGRVIGGDVNDTAEEDRLVSRPADKGRCCFFWFFFYGRGLGGG